VGLVAFVLAAGTWWALTATAVAGAGSAIALAGLETHAQVVDGPLGTPAAASAGHVAAGVIGAAAIAAGAAFAGARRYAPASWRGSRTLALALAGGAAAVLVAVVALSHPVRRVEAFTADPVGQARGGSVSSHLLSFNGNGRWALWSSAVDAWKQQPVAGGGAGAFEPWWAQHGRLSQYVHDVHSFYLQALAELGLVGAILALLFAAVAVAAMLLRTRDAPRSVRPSLAGAAAAVCAFAVACAADWIWQVTVAGLVAVALTGIVLRGRGAAGAPPTARLRIAVVVAAAAVVAVIALPLVATWQLDVSQAAAARGDARTALDSAARARWFTPWSPDPHVQTALVRERQGRLVEARRALLRGLARDPENWRIWLVRVRLETKLGRGAQAARSLRRAVALNPRSPMWYGYDIPGRK
jgi:hypothetical protein